MTKPQGPHGNKGWVLGLGLAAALVLAIMPASPGGAATGEPKVVAPETVHDFGKVVEDQELTYTFIIENAGGRRLEIEDVDPDCACTAANYDRTIPPGGQGRLTLSIRPFSVLHQFKKETRVRFNDPDHPLVVFTLKGVGQPFIEIIPSHIIRFRGAPGDNLSAQVRFISHLSAPFQITAVRNHLPDKVAVNLQTVIPDKEYVLTVTNKWQGAGAYGGLIELATNSLKRPRLVVRVFGELYLPSAGNP
jgi:hypothetical protein